MTNTVRQMITAASFLALTAGALPVPASADPLSLFPPSVRPESSASLNPNTPLGYAQDSIIQPSITQRGFTQRSTMQDSITADEPAALPRRLQRQVVDYPTREAPGTIVIDTGHTYLYYVLGNGQAMRYGIGVGREGFTWSGVQTVARKAEWPDWHPPAEMIGRQPYLPRFMAGGPGNPLGARAMYLGDSMYRIHGTNDPTTIGKRVSSGCIRLTNADVEDLYSRVTVGTKVVVLPATTHVSRATDLSSARRVPVIR